MMMEYFVIYTPELLLINWRKSAQVGGFKHFVHIGMAVPMSIIVLTVHTIHRHRSAVVRASRFSWGIAETRACSTTFTVMWGIPSAAALLARLLARLLTGDIRVAHCFCNPNGIGV